MTIGERFRQVRKLADEPKKKCSQADFGEMFKIGRDAVANIENGRVEPTELLMRSVCNKFDISYEWLAEGIEPMQVPRSEEEETAAMVAAVLDGPPDFQRAVVKMICTRTPEELKVLEKALQDVLDNIKKE